MSNYYVTYDSCDRVVVGCHRVERVEEKGKQWHERIDDKQDLDVLEHTYLEFLLFPPKKKKIRFKVFYFHSYNFKLIFYPE